MAESSLLYGLNDAQKQAVLHSQGPLLLLAGAGSGKTKTITHRIAYLVQHTQVPPERILAVTFTNKAATEMRERLAHILQVAHPTRSFFPWMGTFHSICVRMLRIDGEQIEIPREFVIFDDNDSINTIKQVAKEHHIDEKKHSARSIQACISQAKNELVTPSEYEQTARLPLQKVVAKLYPAYEKKLREARGLDFDDIIGQTVRLLSTVTDIRQKWQNYFHSIMIDEYQDTNKAQYQLIKLLLNPTHNNICVVGDDWQSIYSWRGADYTNILRFESDYPGTTVIKLEQNYRSTKPILDAAHAVIEKNTARSTKKLWTAQTEGAPVHVSYPANEHQEAEFIVGHVIQEVRKGTRQYRDFAVLYRTNAQSRSLEDSMIRYGIPYKIVGGVRFYDRKEIKDILAYLRLLYQPRDLTSFQRIVNIPARGIGQVSQEKFIHWHSGFDRDIISSLTGASDCHTITPRARQAFTELGALLTHLQEDRHNMNLADFIESIIHRLQYLAYLDDGTIQAEDRQNNVRELLSVATQYIDLGLDGFLEEVALVTHLDEMNETSNSVTLMTLHAAKGLEFPVVFMTGMEESLFPHSRAMFDAQEMEEERRLCYVGMTRAKEELYLSAASSRLIFGTKQFNMPSRFLKDLEAGEVDHIAPSSASPSFLESEIIYDTPEYALEPGDRVAHTTFGKGTVVQVMDTMAEISFDTIGVKKLNTSFAPITKIDS